MLQREQIIRGKEHWPPKCVVLPPFSLFTCLATTQQRLVTSPRDPGVVSLHVNAGHFSTTAKRVTSPTWGPPPPCKQALNLPDLIHRWVVTFIQFHAQPKLKLKSSLKSVLTNYNGTVDNNATERHGVDNTRDYVTRLRAVSNPWRRTQKKSKRSRVTVSLSTPALLAARGIAARMSRSQSR